MNFFQKKMITQIPLIILEQELITYLLDSIKNKDKLDLIQVD